MSKGSTVAALAVFCVSFLILCTPAWLMGEADAEGAALSLGVIGVSGFLFIVSHIIRSRAYEEMLGKIVIALLLAIGCAVPILQLICIPALLFFTLVNIAEALKSLVDLRLHIAVSLVLAALLTFIEQPGDPAFIGYVLVAAGFSWRICRRPFYFAMLELSVMAISVPLSALILISIVAGLRALFSVTTSAITSNIRVTQNVAAHVRAGTDVGAYTREVTKAVTNTVSTVAAGGGAPMIAVGAGMSAAAGGSAEGAGTAGEEPGEVQAALAGAGAGPLARRWMPVVVVLALVVAAMAWLGDTASPAAGSSDASEAQAAVAAPVAAAAAGEQVFYPVGGEVLAEGPPTAAAASAPAAPAAPAHALAEVDAVPATQGEEAMAPARPAASAVAPVTAERPAAAPVGVNMVAVNRMLARARSLQAEGRLQEAAAVAANVLAFDPANAEAQGIRAAAR